MNTTIPLETSEVAALEHVAEGLAASMPDDVAERLFGMGLIQKADARAGNGETWQLTSAGLAVIRSSDQ
ncbi:hypothetical protein ISP15_04680 [Dyella jejuensis]|uniref:Uncharacterized protein n=1 Tax=Dyella jejuensis TaxID=1432009 RepID=A0ABW8JEX8_9GAMM